MKKPILWCWKNIRKTRAEEEKKTRVQSELPDRLYGIEPVRLQPVRYRCAVYSRRTGSGIQKKIAARMRVQVIRLTGNAKTQKRNQW